MNKKTARMLAFSAIALLAGSAAHAQQWLTPFTTPPGGPGQIITDVATTDVIIDNGARLGINTTGPLADPLTLNGDMGFQVATGIIRAIRANTDMSFDLYANSGIINGGALRLYANGVGPKPGSVELSAAGSGSIEFGTNGGMKQAEITSSGEFDFTPSSNIRSVRAQSDNGIEIYGGYDVPGTSGNKGGAGIHLASDNRPSGSGAVTLTSGGSPGSPTSNEAGFSFLQYNGGVYTPSLYINKNGKTGIGTNNPTEKLTIDGNVAFTSDAALSTTTRREVFGNSKNGLSLYGGTNADAGASILLKTNGSYYGNGNMQLMAGGTTATTGTAFDFDIFNGAWNASTTLMNIKYNGNVGIGSGDPQYKLTVNGDIAFENTGTRVIRSIRGQALYGYLEMYAGQQGNDGPALFMYGNGWTRDANHNYGTAGQVEFWATGGNSYNNHDPAFLLTHYNSNQSSQVWTGLMRINKNGAVGLGTDPGTDADCDERLTVKGGIVLKSTYGSDFDRSIKAKSDQGRLGIFSGNSSDDGSYIILSGKGHTNTGDYASIDPHGNPGRIDFVSYAANNANDEKAFVFTTYHGNNQWNWQEQMIMNKSGQVAIGHDLIANGQYNNHPDYKLFVQGGILTERVRVALRGTADWADYVFAKDYKLKSLKEVENFIAENKHLPDVPSAEDVVKEGIDMAKMDAKLLQKIEELTLYMIEQRKQAEQQQQQIAAQQKQIEELKKQLKK